MFRARLRARLCRGKEGLHRAPTFVRQFGGYTHHLLLLIFLSSTHYYYCPLFHPLLSEIYPLLTTLVVVVVVVVVFTLKAVPVSTQYFLTSVLVQLTRTPSVTLRPSKSGLKRQSLLQTWCGSAPRRGPSANGYGAWRLDSADPGARSLQLLLHTWCGSAPRRGPSANGYDAWRFGSCGPARKILAAAAADLVWVCAPPRTMLLLLLLFLRLAAGTMPNSLYRMPLVYLSLTCVFCYSCSFLFVVCVFVFFFALVGAW